MQPHPERPCRRRMREACAKGQRLWRPVHADPMHGRCMACSAIPPRAMKAASLNCRCRCMLLRVARERWQPVLELPMRRLRMHTPLEETLPVAVFCLLQSCPSLHAQLHMHSPQAPPLLSAGGDCALARPCWDPRSNKPDASNGAEQRTLSNCIAQRSCYHQTNQASVAGELCWPLVA